MKYLLFALVLATGVSAATVPPPPFENEQLRYSVDWPSGLSLGEGQLQAKHSKVDGEDRWELDLTLDAAIPGFTVRDQFHSIAGPDFSSMEFNKTSTHGQRIAKEKITFDMQKGLITRATTEGGKSEVSWPKGTRDALAFLYYARKELSQGRVPPTQTVIFGAPYQVRLEYAGNQVVRLGEKSVQADNVVMSAKGPASTFRMELFLAQDPVRTPVLIKIPLSMGTFVMELVR